MILYKNVDVLNKKGVKLFTQLFFHIKYFNTGHLFMSIFKIEIFYIINGKAYLKKCKAEGYI